ncbi:hypothetical protein CBR_g51249 [Chara braunii]|uniref:Uncharacterized protein n=1 Tax=Chara braunii TaxID=69332 RepID=A0A388M8F6_CHABU|nr:hypothetical protein CBR_g51249 [Chara braunii]|eukprot:GBG90742.1 hypothetical protein CBR_g51249 [Chara braunii]
MAATVIANENTDVVVDDWTSATRQLSEPDAEAVESEPAPESDSIPTPLDNQEDDDGTPSSSPSTLPLRQEPATNSSGAPVEEEPVQEPPSAIGSEETLRPAPPSPPISEEIVDDDVISKPSEEPLPPVSGSDEDVQPSNATQNPLPINEAPSSPSTVEGEEEVGEEGVSIPPSTPSDEWSDIISDGPPTPPSDEEPVPISD